MTYLGLVGLGEIVRHDGSVGVFLGGVVALVQDLVGGTQIEGGGQQRQGGREGGRVRGEAEQLCEKFHYDRPASSLSDRVTNNLPHTLKSTGRGLQVLLVLAK